MHGKTMVKMPLAIKKRLANMASLFANIIIQKLF